MPSKDSCYWKSDLRYSELSIFFKKLEELETLDNFLKVKNFQLAKNELTTILNIVLSKYLNIKIYEDPNENIISLYHGISSDIRLFWDSIDISTDVGKNRCFLQFDELISNCLYLIDKLKTENKTILLISQTKTCIYNEQKMPFNFIFFDKTNDPMYHPITLKKYNFLIKSDWKIEKLLWIAILKIQDKNCFLNLLLKDLIIVILLILFPKKHGLFTCKEESKTLNKN